MAMSLPFRSRARTSEAGGPSMVPPVGTEQPSLELGTLSSLSVPLGLLLQLPVRFLYCQSLT